MPLSRFIIYALHHNDSPRIYIGRSSTGLERPRQHGKTKTCFPVSRWAHKLSKQGKTYSIAVLEEFDSPEHLNEAERFYISYFRSLGIPLLNCTDGGEGLYNATAETRAKLSAAMTGRTFTPEWKAKISRAKTKNSPKEHIVALNKSRIGKPLSEAHKATLSKAHLNSIASIAQRKRLFAQNKERHPRAILTMSQVEEIRTSLSVSLKDFALRFGVCKTTIHAVRSGQNWAKR